jgi:hypothetical protein
MYPTVKSKRRPVTAPASDTVTSAQSSNRTVNVPVIVKPKVVPEELSVEPSRIVTLVEDPTLYHMCEIPTPQTDLFQNVHLYQYRPETILVEIPVGASLSLGPQPGTSGIGTTLQTRLGPPEVPLSIMSRLGPSDWTRCQKGVDQQKEVRI